jgi:hypothetical protein
MAGRSPGPYDYFPMDGGQTAPFYLILFDKKGRCQSPVTLQKLLDEAKSRTYTDIHVFSHGWNNVFKDALTLYRDFFGHYFKLLREHIQDPAYRPIIVGIIWPSTLLVLPWESAPHIAGGAPGVPDERRAELAGADHQALSDIAGELEPRDSERLYSLAEAGDSLSAADARELAGLLLPFYQGSSADTQSAEVGEAAPQVTADDILQIWAEAVPQGARQSTQAGFADDDDGAGSTPEAAALNWKDLDPRWPIRIASVLQMKDRAGTVGAKGVGPLLVANLLSAKAPRVHLIGHSYGGKVMLSSLCAQPVAQPAASLLLLEPAVSYLCFGENLDNKGRRGGYRGALDRVNQPILSTFSSSDAPLTQFFHRAVIRNSDWGEQRIAGEPPNKFAALGGFGPGGLRQGESKTLDVLSPDLPPPGSLYPRGEAGIKIYGLNGSNGQIKGHGDVATKFTAWAHLNLVSGGNLK